MSRVISGPRLDLIALFILDLELAVAAVEFRVGRSEADVVLAAQLGGDLVEGLLQLVHLVAHVDHPASGGFGQFAHFGFAGVAAAEPAIKSAIGAQQHVDDGVRFLRRFNRVPDLQLAAFVLAVGQQNHCLAPHFFRQHVVGGQINGVVEHGAGLGRSGYRTAAGAGYWTGGVTGVDLYRIQRFLQTVNVAGEILQQTGIDVEVDDEGFIFVGQDLFQERATDFLLHVEDSQLTAAGVDQNSERERQVRLGGKIFHGLRLAVFRDIKVSFGKVRHECAVLVFDVKENLHDVDVHLQSFGGLLILVVGLLISGLLIRGRLGRRLLGRSEWGGQAKGSHGDYKYDSVVRNKKFRHSGTLSRFSVSGSLILRRWMYQMEWFGHLTGQKAFWRVRKADEEAMAPVKRNTRRQRTRGNMLLALAIVVALAIPALQAQSGSQPQSQPPASSQPAQDIPDAPSTVQPPAPKPVLPPAPPPGSGTGAEANPFPGDKPAPGNGKPGQDTQNQDKAAQPSTTPAATGKQRNQIDPKEGLYTIGISVNRVQVPVMVKDSSGRRVDGLLYTDFTVLENGKKQTLVYFTSDPFALSVAVVIDTGMADVALQKINETYSALAGAFSPYDEVALYTYSSTVSQVTDFTGRPERLTAALNDMKQYRGHANGPAVLGGPLGPEGPTINGLPAGGPPVPPVYTPPREAHVLNDAILRAAQDLSKRDRERRKVIFVISDGREMGSRASYRRRAAPAAGSRHSGQSCSSRQRRLAWLSAAAINSICPIRAAANNPCRNIVRATCGADLLAELSRNSIEDAYAEITSEARNQYTLGYNPQAITGNSAYRSIEVRVDRKGLKVAAKDGYFAIPTAH